MSTLNIFVISSFIIGAVIEVTVLVYVLRYIFKIVIDATVDCINGLLKKIKYKKLKTE